MLLLLRLNNGQQKDLLRTMLCVRAVRTTVWGISVRAASVATSCCKGSVRSKCIRKCALSNCAPIFN